MKWWLLGAAPEPDRTITDHVESVLRGRAGAYLTTNQIAVMTGLTFTQVNGAIATLRKRGHVDRLLDGERGRHSGQSYRWRP